MRVPFLDLAAPHAEMEADLTQVFQSALRGGTFVGGPMVEGFEADFAAFAGTRFAVGVASGTDALRFALMAGGVGDGQVVITAPNTFIATAEAITQAGARAEFVDVEPRTLNMDPVRLEEYLESACQVDSATGKLLHKRTGAVVAAIVPVHLYGHPVEMDAILDLARRYRLQVIEDACQAHGSEYFSACEQRWRKAGSMGRAAAFSFYPGKNLGACGEAGAVTTNDEQIAKRVRMLRDHGQAQKYYHDIEGYNGRLDAIQAGILAAKLKRLGEWNRRRRKAAAIYDELLAPALGDRGLPFEAPWARGNFHLYVIRTAEREALRARLGEAGIGTGIHYPVPLHLQRAYERLEYRKGDFPVAESAAEEILSLPMYPEITRAQQAEVASCVLEFLSSPAGREALASR